MIKIGYPMMTEQAGPRQLAEDLVGAAAQATSRVPWTTYVTRPTFRCHPVAGAQKAA